MLDFTLKSFRNQVDHLLENAKDAVFELTDAVMLSPSPNWNCIIIFVLSISQTMAQLPSRLSKIVINNNIN